MRIAILLLLAPLALADEEVRPGDGLILSFDNATAETAAKLLKNDAGLKVQFAPQCKGKRIELQIRGLPAKSAIERIAEAFDCKAQHRGGMKWRVLPGWQIDLLKKLEGTRVVDLAVDEMRLDQFLRLVRDQTRADIVLDPAIQASRTITLQANNTNYRALLDLVTQPNEMRWELRYGVVFISTATRLKNMPIHPPAIPGTARTRVPINFDKVNLPAVCQMFQVLMGVRIEVPKEFAKTKVSAKVKRVRFDEALALLLYPVGLTVTEKESALTVGRLPAGK